MKRLCTQRAVVAGAWVTIAFFAGCAQRATQRQSPDAESQLSEARRQLNRARRSRSESRVGEWSALDRIAGAYSRMGMIDSAMTYARLALRASTDFRIGRMQTLARLGGLHSRVGREDSAMAYFRMAIAISRGAPCASDAAMVPNCTDVVAAQRLQVFHSIAGIFSSAGALDVAYRYFTDIFAAAQNLRDQQRRSIQSNALGGMASVHSRLGQVDSAAFYRRWSFELRERPDWPDPFLAPYYAQTGMPDSALAIYLRFLGWARERDPSTVSFALSALAYFYHRQNHPPNLVRAVAYYDSATAVSALFRTASETGQVGLRESEAPFHEAWALAWLGLQRELGRQEAAAAALAATERGRAQVLLDLMTAAAGELPPKSFGRPEPDTGSGDLASEGRRLAGVVARTGATGLSYLVTEDTLVIWMIEPSGRLRAASRPVAKDSLAVLAVMLRAGLGLDDPAVSSQLALRGAPSLERVTPERPTRSWTTRHAQEAASSLARLLLPPELAEFMPDTGEVVVVPHGILAIIPFAVLPLGRADDLGNPFGNAYAIRYSPSLATLQLAEDRAGQGAGLPSRDELRRSVIVGNPVMPNMLAYSSEVVPLAPLPRTEAEAQWVANKLRAPFLTGPEASEREVRNRIPQAPLVHLATHAYAYGTDAMARQSYVALAPGHGHDGLLTAGEILADRRLTLRAELVVLSACQTGMGNVKEAEGTIGLQRAFLAKGARSLLVSLWSVSDVATEQLMQRFYTHWLEDPDNPSKAESLRRAQQDVRTTLGLEHPRFWAGFQLVGAR